MKNLEPGTHIKVSRNIYDHHGIYVGDDRVIHYSGLANSLEKGSIEETSLEDFLGTKNKIEIVNYQTDKSYSTSEVVDRAYSRLGEDDYNLIFNNCEHFACWCVTGCSHSQQVTAAMSTVTYVIYYHTKKSPRLRVPPLTNTAVSPIKTAPISVMPTTQATTHMLQSSVVGGLVGGGGAIATTSLVGGSAMATGLVGASIAAAPVAVPALVIGAVVGGLFS
ncbi:MAG TPA: lecithin retinol acyltransferase family protein, partial [Agitococcus sp.]|nr:lecithin retinol acyltransferase family protein [Agitococcus sp.]